MSSFGISISVVENEDGKPIVEGRFSAPAEGDIDYAHHARRALVLVVSASFGYLADRPFESRVPFEDDVRAGQDAVAGSFALALEDFIDLEQEDTNIYYVLMSIGPYLSNIEVLEA